MDKNSVSAYVKSVPEGWKKGFLNLLKILRNSIPKGFAEAMQYGMISYQVPLSAFPEGYLKNPEVPLPFVALASQKNYISFYHMGLYGNKDLLAWFLESAEKETGEKIRMGKSCIRFSKTAKIPVKTIRSLMKKISVKDWIASYKAGIMSRKSG